MNSKGLKLKEFERYLYGGLLLAGMFLAAQFTGHKEIIFPEIFALITGCWIAKKTPWNTNGIRIVGLTTLSALLGVLTVKYLPAHIYWKILFCFISTEMFLVISKTNLVPIIPAGIFPIFMNVKSFVYPTAVLIMTTIIVLGQALLVKNHHRHKDRYNPSMFNQIADLKRFIKLAIIFAIISVFPMNYGFKFWLSPPVVVTFVELSAPMSMNRKRPVQIWEVMSFAALTGTIFRFIFNIYFSYPLIVAAMFACITYFIYCKENKILYPPASGALLMPLILRPSDVLWYPIEVAVGLALLIPISLYLFPPKKAMS